jgi:hypothetical protein
MKGKHRIRLTYANVVASIALFAALGGSSYAAFSLPAKSVGAKQLRSGAVRTAKVKDGSLLAKDFKSGQLPAGPKGDRGPQGVPGVPGEPGQAGTARAYALVDENGASNGVDPALVQPYVKAFASVRRTSMGFYCVHPAAGIDPATMPAIVNAEFGFSAGSDLKAYWEQGHCNADEYQVVTEQGGAKSNDVAFTILVP